MKIEIKLDNNTYFLPQAWEDLNWNQYGNIIAIQNDESLSETEKAVHIIAALTDIELDLLNEIGFEYVIPLWKRLDFLQTQIESVPVSHITINNVNYYAQSITKTGELLAFDKVQTAFKTDIQKKLPYILAILLRKSTEKQAKYTPKSLFNRVFKRKSTQNTDDLTLETFENDFNLIEKKANYFSQTVNPVQFINLAAFFLQKEQLSTTIFQLSLLAPSLITKKIESFQNILEKNTDGSPLFTKLNQIYLNMIAYYIKISIRS